MEGIDTYLEGYHAGRADAEAGFPAVCSSTRPREYRDGYRHGYVDGQAS